MNGSKQKQIILKEMRNIYYKDISPRYDWMGYLITEENKPSYHHIVKAEELKKMKSLMTLQLKMELI